MVQLPFGQKALKRQTNSQATHNTALQSTRYRAAPIVALRQRSPELGRYA